MNTSFGTLHVKDIVAFAEKQFPNLPKSRLLGIRINPEAIHRILLDKEFTDDLIELFAGRLAV